MRYDLMTADAFQFLIDEQATADLAVTEPVSEPAIEPVTVTEEPLEPVLDPDETLIAAAEWLPGDIIFEAAPGDVVNGNSGGDIIWLENLNGVTLNGNLGDDILVMIDGSGRINAGAGHDIVDVTRFDGIITLGTGDDYDMLVVWDVAPGQYLDVYNFNPEFDQYFTYLDNITEADTSAGLELSTDGRAFMTVHGFHPADDVLA